MTSILKKSIVILILIMISLTTTAHAKNSSDIKVGVVDMKKVEKKSVKFKNLQYLQNQRLKKFQNWTERAKLYVSKRQTEENKALLTEKYNSDFARKKEFIQTSYDRNYASINDSFSETINNYADKKGYVMIFEKSSVLYGGKNLTGPIGRRVK